MKKFYKHIAVICLFFFMVERGESAITSVTLTPATPTTVSTGLAYYLAGKTYTFTVNVIDPAATGWGDISDVSITISNSTNIAIAIDPVGTGAHTTTGNTGPVTSTASVSGTYNNMTVTFNVTFHWTTAESAWSASRQVIASATSSNTRTDTKYVSYGVCSSVQVLNIAMTGEAADGKVNRWHNTFNVTGGNVIYALTGATSADSVNSLADAGVGEITRTELRINGSDPGGTDDTDETNGQSIDVPGSFLNSIGDSTATRTVEFYIFMSTGGATEVSTTTTSIICNRISVTDITFFGGGGVDSDPTGYLRSTKIPETQVRIDAVMEAGSGVMDGNTYIELRDTTDGSITTVVIANGQTYGTALLNIINYPTTLGVNGTQYRSYEIYNIYGGSYGSPSGYGQYTSNSATAAARITQPVTHTITWDNADHPGANANTFTPFISHSTTAGSMTVNWTPLTAGFPDADFDQYKFYYRRSATDGSGNWIDSGVWTVVDKTTTGYTDMATISTGTITVSGLEPMTNYDYMVSAVDIFGNEVSGVITDTAGSHKIMAIKVATAPSSITFKITDGITAYTDTSFTGNPDPAVAHRLRKANLRIDTEIITTGNMASQVDIIIADNAGDVAAQWGTGASDDMRTLLATAGATYTFPTVKTSPNIWTGYIPSENELMTVGRSIRIIFKITYLTGVVYVDHDSELELPPGNPTDQEWRINIYEEPKFTPWPVKILNNVITDTNPVAYPAYYLNDDAYVTIKVHDIKGRVVATILEEAYRKAGQNIKEQGWRGTNKYNKKLGVGLYYIHVKAKRVSDGKVILDTFKKVVMSR